MALSGFTKVAGVYRATPLSTSTAGGKGGVSVVETHGSIAELTDAALAAKFPNAGDAQPDDLIWVGTPPNDVLHRMKQGADNAQLAVNWGPATAMTDLSGLATSTELNAAISRIATLESAPPIDLAPYARITQLPDVSNFITLAALNPYALKTEIPAEANLAPYALKTELPDLTPYARSSDIPNVSSFITAAALNPYALKSELPDVTGLASTSALANYATAAALSDLTGRVDPLESSVAGLGTKEEVTFLTNKDQYQPNSTELFTTPVLVRAGFDLTDANIMRVALRGDVGKAGAHEIGSAWFDNTMINLWGSNWSAKAPVIVNGVSAILTLSATSNAALKNGDFSISLNNLGGGKVFFMKIIAYQWKAGSLLV